MTECFPCEAPCTPAVYQCFDYGDGKSNTDEESTRIVKVPDHSYIALQLPARIAILYTLRQRACSAIGK